MQSPNVGCYFMEGRPIITVYQNVTVLHVLLWIHFSCVLSVLGGTIIYYILCMSLVSLPFVLCVCWSNIQCQILIWTKQNNDIEQPRHPTLTSEVPIYINHQLLFFLIVISSHNAALGQLGLKVSGRAITSSLHIHTSLGLWDERTILSSPVKNRTGELYFY